MRTRYTYWTFHWEGELTAIKRVPHNRRNLMGIVVMAMDGWKSATYRDYVAAKRELAARRKREQQEAKRA